MDLEAPPANRQLKLTKPGEKLLVPDNYRPEGLLEGFALHAFSTSSDVKDKLDADVTEWATLKDAYALLINADEFWVAIREDRRFHGGCAIVKTVHFAQNVKHPEGYSVDPDERISERPMRKGNCKVDPDLPGSPVLKRYDAYGDVWCRRRYTLHDSETYSFVQWMDSKALKLKERPQVTRLADVAEHIKSLEESYNALHNEVSEMKTMLRTSSTLSDTTLALAESVKQIVMDQATAHTSLIEKIDSLRSEIRRA